MPDLQSMGKILFIVGIIIVATGGILMLVGRVPFLGNLPGDIRIQRENWGCYIPIVTSILLSLILTILLNIVARLFK